MKHICSFLKSCRNNFPSCASFNYLSMNFIFIFPTIVYSFILVHNNSVLMPFRVLLHQIFLDNNFALFFSKCLIVIISLYPQSLSSSQNTVPCTGTPTLGYSKFAILGSSSLLRQSVFLSQINFLSKQVWEEGQVN